MKRWLCTPASGFSPSGASRYVKSMGRPSELTLLNRLQQVCIFSEKRVLNRAVSDPTGYLQVSLLSRKMHVRGFVRDFRALKYLPTSSHSSQVKTPGSQQSCKGSEELLTDPPIPTISISPTESGKGKKQNKNQTRIN